MTGATRFMACLLVTAAFVAGAFILDAVWPDSPFGFRWSYTTCWYIGCWLLIFGRFKERDG